MITSSRVSCAATVLLNGCLQYIAVVKPPGMPFLVPLIHVLSGHRKDRDLPEVNKTVPKLVQRLLCMWDRILTLYKGMSMDYILDRLPKAKFDISRGRYDLLGHRRLL